MLDSAQVDVLKHAQKHARDACRSLDSGASVNHAKLNDAVFMLETAVELLKRLAATVADRQRCDQHCKRGSISVAAQTRARIAVANGH